MMLFATVTDLSGPANLERLLDFLLLGLFGAISFYALCRAKAGKETWSRILLGGALVAFAARAALTLGSASLEVLRNRPEGHETPALGPSYESWHLVGESAGFIMAAALLLIGVALFSLGGPEKGKASGGVKKRR